MSKNQFRMAFEYEKLYQKTIIFYNFHPINLLLFGILNHFSIILNEIVYGRNLKILIMNSIWMLMHFLISWVIFLAFWFLFTYFLSFLCFSWNLWWCIKKADAFFQKSFCSIVGNLHFHWPCSYLVVKMHQITYCSCLHSDG